MYFSTIAHIVLKVVSLSLTTAGTAMSSTTAATSKPTLAPYTYNLLPIGAIKPQGWINDQLVLQGEGLSGNLFTFYRYVKNSIWTGGTDEYSELHESAPYWYNAIVPLAYVLDDERLKDQANYFLDYVVGHQADDGWLGPETTRETRGIWARCLLLQGMMNHAIADPNQSKKIITAMHKFVTIAHSMLADNYTGFIQQPGDDFDPWGFGTSRAHELSTTLQWLYETHPDGQEQVIWETMNFMWAGAKVKNSEWDKFFVDGVFPQVGTPEYPVQKLTSFMHGVNMAQGLRYMTQLYRMTKNESLIQQSRDAVAMVVKYQGASSGTIIADEYIGGQSPQRGSELCMAVEMIFSLSYLYRFIGDNSFADRAELAAFNALPAAIAPDHWSHQYVTQTNQPWSQNLTGKPFYNVVSYGNVFGLEPNFPCCTVNHGQALPKFLMSSFVTEGTTGLVHMFLIPATVSTTIKGQHVSVACDTTYPFGNTLHYTINSNTAFDFSIRIPDWATPSSTISINRQHSLPLKASSASTYKIAVQRGTTDIVVTLGADIRTVPRENNTVAIYHGSLLYALDIAYTTSTMPALNWTDQTPLPPSPAHDHFLLPTSNWSVAIDPSQLRFAPSQDYSSAKLKNPIFSRGAPPVSIWAAASNIEWPETQGTADLPPSEVKKVGEPFWAKLVPYGSAKLHMGEFPVVQLEKLKV